MSCSVVPPLDSDAGDDLALVLSGTPPPIAENLPPETKRRG